MLTTAVTRTRATANPPRPASHADYRAFCCAVYTQFSGPTRRDIAMEPGDDALVFRLQGRFPEGCLLTLSSLSSLSYEFGVLARIS